MDSLYLITDQTQAAGRTLPAVLADALEGGVRMIQLREKDLSPRELFELATELRVSTRNYSAQLIINDRLDIALAAGADGVHLGITSIPVAEARRLLGKSMLIGYSSHSIAEALRAERDGADFVTFGPVYETASKRHYGAPLGIELLAQAASVLSIPVYALGGITHSSIADVMASGSHGVALISAVMAAHNPRQVTKELLMALHKNSHCQGDV